MKQMCERRSISSRRNHKCKTLEVKPILVCLRDSKAASMGGAE